MVSNKTQYYSEEFKKGKYEIQDCEDFQPCRKFIAEELAIHLIIRFKKVKAAELKINPFITIRFLPGQKLSFFQILIPLGYKTSCHCPHVNASCSLRDVFGDTGVPMVFKGIKSCLGNNGI